MVGSDEGWTTRGHHFIGRRVERSHDGDDGETQSRGTIEAWLPPVVDDPFVDGKTGKPAPLFKVLFDDGELAGELEDLEEREVEESLIVDEGNDDEDEAFEDEGDEEEEELEVALHNELEEDDKPAVTRRKSKTSGEKRKKSAVLEGAVRPQEEVDEEVVGADLAASYVLKDLGPLTSSSDWGSINSLKPLQGAEGVMNAGGCVVSVDLCPELWDGEVVVAVATLTTLVDVTTQAARGLAAVPLGFEALASSSSAYGAAVKQYLAPSLTGEQQEERGEIQVWTGSRLAYAIDEKAICATFARTGRCLAVISRKDGAMRVFKLCFERRKDRHLLQLAPTFEASLRTALLCCARWNQTDLIATGANDGCVAVFRFGEQTPLAVFEGVRGRSMQTGTAVRALAWRSETQLGLVSESGWIQLWQVGRCVQFPIFETRLPLVPLANGLEWLPHGDGVVVSHLHAAALTAISLTTLRAERLVVFDYEKEGGFAVDSAQSGGGKTWHYVTTSSDGTARIVTIDSHFVPQPKLLFRITRSNDEDDDEEGMPPLPGDDADDVDAAVDAAFRRLRAPAPRRADYKVSISSCAAPKAKLLAPPGLCVLSARFGRAQAAGIIVCGAQCGLIKLDRVKADTLQNVVQTPLAKKHRSRSRKPNHTKRAKSAAETDSQHLDSEKPSRRRRRRSDGERLKVSDANARHHQLEEDCVCTGERATEAPGNSVPT